MELVLILLAGFIGVGLTTSKWTDKLVIGLFFFIVVVVLSWYYKALEG